MVIYRSKLRPQICMIFVKLLQRRDGKMFTPSQKSEFVLWYREDGSPRNVQRKFRRKYGGNVKAPDEKCIMIWNQQFTETGACLRR